MVQQTEKGIPGLRINEGQKYRYWDPRDGQYTHPLAANPSAKIFYTERKGFLMKPPGRLAWYVNPKKQDSHHPDPVEREREKSIAVVGPFPTGEKLTICRCAQNCKNWPEHYKKQDLEFLRFEDEPEDPKELSDMEVDSILKSLERRGYRMEKVPVEEESHGDNDNSQEGSGKEPESGAVRRTAGAPRKAVRGAV